MPASFWAELVSIEHNKAQPRQFARGANAGQHGGEETIPRLARDLLNYAGQGLLDEASVYGYQTASLARR